MTKTARNSGFVADSIGVSLTVRDVAASRDWYRDVLGFEAQREMEREGKLRGVAMVAGGARILLNQDDGAKGWDRRKGEGFSLNLVTKQDSDELAARIRSAGGTLDTEPADMPWGSRVFRLRDPDGYLFAISTPIT
jgi:uncharacterized glyoxalase superfamily protein PhnB